MNPNLFCGLLGRGPDGKCNKKPMKVPPTSPLTVQEKKKKQPSARVSPVSFEKQQGGRIKTRRKKRKKKKRKTKKRRKRKTKKRRKRRR